MQLAKFHHELRDGVLCVWLKGEIDMSNAEPLRRALAEATPNDSVGVILDLSEADYIDSAGIHLLYHLRENLRTRGQRLALVIPAGSITSGALRLAGVERGREIVETLADGVRALLPGETSAPSVNG